MKIWVNPQAFNIVSVEGRSLQTRLKNEGKTFLWKMKVFFQKDLKLELSYSNGIILKFREKRNLLQNKDFI